MTYSSLAAPRTVPRRAVAVPTFCLPDITPAMLMFVLACLLGLLYLVQVTALDANGYKLNDLQNTETSLRQENNDLTVASARLQSLDRQRQYAAGSGLVAVSPE